MFEIAFSLHGRLDRLQFLLGALALGVAYAIGLGGLLIGGVAAVAAHKWAVVALLVLALLPLALAVLWCSLSLLARRIRDAGLDPALVIGARIVTELVHKLVMESLVAPYADALARGRAGRRGR